MAGLTTFSERRVYHRGMDVIYADELFAVNALTDALLLQLTALWCGIPARRGRVWAAGALGGLYAVCAVLPGAAWVRGALMKGAVSFLLPWAAFGGGAGLWRRWGAFWCLSAGCAGIVTAAALLSGKSALSGMPLRAEPRLLLPALGLCYAAVRLTRPGARGGRQILTAEISLGRRTAAFPVLRDTGNGLVDPLSALPVLIAEPGALSGLFSPALPETLPEDAGELFRRLSARPELAGRLRLVAYSSLGNPGGLLVCLKPDRAALNAQARELLVGLSPTPFGGEYRGVF